MVPAMIDHVIEVDGVRLRARTLGSIRRDRPTLVFIHEGLGCIELWGDFPQALCDATGLAALIYDREGYGGSDPLRAQWGLDYRHHQGRDVLPLVLDRMGVGPAVLVGHSDGGVMALIFAAAYPERARGVVALAPQVCMAPACLDGMAAIIRRFESGGKLREVLRRFHGEKADRTFYNWAHTWISEAFMAWRMPDDLARVRCPVLAIFGAKDEYGIDHLIDHLRRDLKVPPAITVLAEAAHIPHHEDRAGTLAQAVGFIAALTAPPPLAPCKD